jgi:hypothetical protein
VLLGFLRLVTRPRVLPNPLSVKQALGLVALWLAQPASKVIAPGDRHFELPTLEQAAAENRKRKRSGRTWAIGGLLLAEVLPKRFFSIVGVYQ